MNLQPSLMLVSNAEAYQSGAPERRIPPGWATGLTYKDRLVLKGLSGTNTVAYLEYS
jgi:hypothetical protein